MLDEFSEYYADFLDGTWDCVDRIVINAYWGHIIAISNLLYGLDSTLQRVVAN